MPNHENKYSIDSRVLYYCYQSKYVLALRCSAIIVTGRGEADIAEDRPFCAEYMYVANYLNKKKKIKKKKTHLGINKCKQRTREVQYWPGMRQQIEDMISDCVLCNTYQNKQPAELLCPTPTLDRPWQELVDYRQRSCV